MPWCDITRKVYIRETKRFPSDLTDQEWELIEPFLPPAKPIGRPRKTNLRCVVNAILYIASSGCQWRMLPKDFPAYSTVQYYFYDWVRCEIWDSINHILVQVDREMEWKEASPSAGVIDSQSVKTTESGGTCRL